jgi:hypothetical protein
LSDLATQSARTVPAPLEIDIRSLFLIALWAVLTVVGGMQWFGLSVDNHAYYGYYQNLNPGLGFGMSRFEPGFQLWAWFCKFILNIGFESFLMTLIGLALGIKFYLLRRYTTLPVIAAIAYVLGFFFLHEYTQFRAAVGIAFAFLGLHKQLEGKRIPAAGFYLAGILFHYSVFLIPAIAFLSRYMRRWESIAVMAVGLLAVIFVLPLVGDEAVTFFSRLNPHTESYIYSDAFGRASILSVSNVAMGLATIYAVFVGYLERSTYHRTFLVLGASSLVALVLFADSVILALRLKEVLSIAFLFAFTRSKPDMRDMPLVVLLLISSAYTFWSGLGSLFLF